jgi:hypothetical protein
LSVFSEAGFLVSFFTSGFDDDDAFAGLTSLMGDGDLGVFSADFAGFGLALAGDVNRSASPTSVFAFLAGGDRANH